MNTFAVENIRITGMNVAADDIADLVFTLRNGRAQAVRFGLTDIFILEMVGQRDVEGEDDILNIIHSQNPAGQIQPLFFKGTRSIVQGDDGKIPGHQGIIVQAQDLAVAIHIMVAAQTVNIIGRGQLREILKETVELRIASGYQITEDHGEVVFAGPVESLHIDTEHGCADPLAAGISDQAEAGNAADGHNFLGYFLNMRHFYSSLRIRSLSVSRRIPSYI